MTDWTALARALHPDLPAEDVQRLAPILTTLRERFQPLAAALPDRAEPALVFPPEAAGQ